MGKGHNNTESNIFDKNNRDINILGVISIVKVIAIILIFFGILDNIDLKTDILNKVIIYDLSIFSLSLAPILMIFAYVTWKCIMTYMYETNQSKKIWVVGDIIYILFVTILILVTNAYDSQYKFLYMFHIVSSTIRFGKNYGLKVSWIVSIIICSIDLIFQNDLMVNVYFQNDLIMSAGFIFIAWILGEYVKSETKQREELENELREETKKHNYIEEILLKNEACYDLLIENSKEAIFIHNKKGILYANEHALKLLNVKSLDELNRDNVKYKEYKLINNVKYSEIYDNKASYISFEDKIIDENENVFAFLNTSAFCTYEKDRSILTIIRDITPVKQVQKLKRDVEKNVKLLNETREYNRYITELFSNISHELKTPLNIIYSSAQLLKSYYSDSKLEIKKLKYIESIYHNCNRLTRLINNLLDITKFDSGFVTLQKQNENIISDVEDIVMSVIPYAEKKGIEIIFDTDVEERIMAYDQDKIERIILNLLSNALKFTNEGDNIFISIFNRKKDISISVKDTGVGIPEDKKELIFERFMQVDKTLRRNHEGTGIGLSLVKSYVDLHEGKIELYSEISKGSEFIITLPVSMIEEDNKELGDSKINTNILEKVSLELSDL